MGARADLAAFLTASLVDDEDPTVKVIDAPDGTDPEPTLDLVVVGSDEVTPGIVANGSRAYQLAVYVVGRQQTPGRADDALDDLLEVVLDALDALPFGTWEKATRVVYRESWPAYQITVTKEL